MTSDEVRALIEREIAGDWARSNLHGCDLRRCMVDPAQREYDDSFNPPNVVELWLVLEEIPETRDGYKIVFSAERGVFGLAVPGFTRRDVLIGYYGTFLETYDAM